MDADSAGSTTATNPTGQVAGAPQGSYKYFFNIGSVDSFEAKMMEAQEQLGWDSDQGGPMILCSLFSVPRGRIIVRLTLSFNVAGQTLVSCNDLIWLEPS